ncbi:uncharacterized protein LOC26536016 [Drosophila yakuba]|uniref:Uncharacterized protein, isoform A n=1 Tax=Drosophila yakuba TaxID=7245 RepID=A0A0R1E323_DROYA|nr:uncharacterized protein LOC26536016 [Drosophila yakuba]KRK01972.1 uncharacterized protein Dyak_GE28835, isoform A [Drosophila yakuba]KRK01973.1 uncharacterized protein Dyak_GE28835, isoform B [Drosophila yakuba]
MCKSCEEQPVRCCTIFYAAFCITSGLFMLLFSIHNVVLLKSSITVLDFYLHIHGAEMSPKTFTVIYAMDLIFGIVHLIAGTLLAFGIRLNSKGVFLAGKILSYFFPIYNVLYVFPLIVHIAAVAKLCKYKNENFS